MLRNDAYRWLVASTYGLGASMVWASDPINPPLTWGIDDGRSISLAYDFDTADTLLSPSMSIGFPGWSGASLSISGDYSWQAGLDAYTGVVMLGAGGAEFTLTNGNLDRPLPWFKEVFIQGIIKGPLGNLRVQSPSDILNETNTVIDLGGDWRLRTITFDLVPQPDSETFTWTWPENEGAFLAAVFIHTHCVPQPGVLAPMTLAVLTATWRRRR